MKRLHATLLAVLLTVAIPGFSQVGINSSGGSPNPSAGLDVDFNDKGFLPPRLTTVERDAISNPATGLVIYNTDSDCLNMYVGSNWSELCGNCIPAPTVANAGPDQTGLSNNSTTLAANTATSGTGAWSIVSGSGGSFGNNADPSSTFAGSYNTTYVLKWTITNSCGFSEDEVTIEITSPPFTCGSSTVSHGGQNYATVQIGTQCWFKENLNIGTMINGGSNQTNNSTIEKYCQQNVATNCDTYGGLYQWNEMMQYTTTAGAQGICPSGWHLPTDPEWQALEVYIGMSPGDAALTGYRGTVAGELRVGGSTGYNMLMSGIRQPPNLFYDIGAQAQQWTSTYSGSGNQGYWRHIYSSGGTIGRHTSADGYGHAARCIKD